MTSGGKTSYVLGYSDSEHLRLVRQSNLLAATTERLFRDAGLCPGMRVLDIGCGMGDVSMLAARLVGPSGRVVGVDQDEGALTKARERVAFAGHENIDLLNADIAQLQLTEHFDAIVGRFIIQFLPEPVLALRSLRKFVRPGGVVAFLEPSWHNAIHQTTHLPLRSAVTALVQDTIEKSGARTNSELHIWRDLQLAGLSPIQMRNVLLMGSAPEMRRYILDLLRNLLPRAKEYGLASNTLETSPRWKRVLKMNSIN